MSKTQAQLLAEINSSITTNGAGAITGAILNGVLQDMVNATFGDAVLTSLIVNGVSNLTGATTIGGALTYGGVALANSVTGTGSMVLSASPTFTGTIAASAANFTSTITGYSGTAIPAGGTTGTGIRVSSTSNFGTFFGSGVPTLSAAQGSVYLRSDGGASTRLYINSNGATGWAAIADTTATGLIVGTSTITSGATTRILYDNAGVLGEYTITGTGTVVAMQTSPAFTTPSLDVATGTSLALGGATIGSNALAVTGTSNFSGNITQGSTAALLWSTDLSLFRDAANTLAQRNGASAQVFNIYNTYTDASNYEVGKFRWFSNTLFVGTDFNGTGVARVLTLMTQGTARWTVDTSGNFIANTDNSVDIGASGATRPRTLYLGTTDATSTSTGALVVAGGGVVAKRFWIPAITASAGLQTAVLCQSSGGEMIADSVACLASSARFKTLLGDAENGALDKIIRVPIHRWKYNRDPESVFPDNYYSEHIGPTAEDIEAIDSRLVGRDQEGRARSISTDQLLALAIQAIQEQQEQIEKLKKAV